MDEFAIDDFNWLDTAELKILAPDGRETNAGLIFSGPGHSKTRQQALRLHDLRQLSSPKSLQQLEAESVLFIVERIVSWRGIKRRGEDGELVEVEFTRESAMELLGIRGNLGCSHSV